MALWTAAHKSHSDVPASGPRREETPGRGPLSAGRSNFHRSGAEPPGKSDRASRGRRPDARASPGLPQAPAGRAARSGGDMRARRVAAARAVEGGRICPGGGTDSQTLRGRLSGRGGSRRTACPDSSGRAAARWREPGCPDGPATARAVAREVAAGGHPTPAAGARAARPEREASAGAGCSRGSGLASATSTVRGRPGSRPARMPVRPGRQAWKAPAARAPPQLRRNCCMCRRKGAARRATAQHRGG
jgi:hypothetical protein